MFLSEIEMKQIIILVLKQSTINNYVLIIERLSNVKENLIEFKFLQIAYGEEIPSYTTVYILSSP